MGPKLLTCFVRHLLLSCPVAPRSVPSFSSPCLVPSRGGGGCGGGGHVGGGVLSFEKHCLEHNSARLLGWGGVGRGCFFLLAGVAPGGSRRPAQRPLPAGLGLVARGGGEKETDRTDGLTDGRTDGRTALLLPLGRGNAWIDGRTDGLTPGLHAGVL